MSVTAFARLRSVRLLFGRRRLALRFVLARRGCLFGVLSVLGLGGRLQPLDEPPVAEVGDDSEEDQAESESGGQEGWQGHAKVGGTLIDIWKRLECIPLVLERKVF